MWPKAGRVESAGRQYGGTAGSFFSSRSVAQVSRAVHRVSRYRKHTLRRSLAALWGARHSRQCQAYGEPDNVCRELRSLRGHCATLSCVIRALKRNDRGWTTGRRRPSGASPSDNGHPRRQWAHPPSLARRPSVGNLLSNVRWFADRSHRMLPPGGWGRGIASFGQLMGSATACLVLSCRADETRAFLRQLWTHPPSAGIAPFAPPTINSVKTSHVGRSRHRFPVCSPRTRRCLSTSPPALPGLERPSGLPRLLPLAHNPQRSPPRVPLRAYPPGRSPSLKPSPRQ